MKIFLDSVDLTEIKRFNEMSNAYSTIAIPDLTRGFTENEIIDYEFALYREAPYSIRNYESDKA